MKIHCPQLSGGKKQGGRGRQAGPLSGRDSSAIQKRGRDWRSSYREGGSKQEAKVCAVFSYSIPAYKTRSYNYNEPTAKAIGARAAVAATPTKAVKLELEEGRYVTVKLPREEEKPTPAPTAHGEGTRTFVNGMSVAEQVKSLNGVVNVEYVEWLRYHCSVSGMVLEVAAKEPCVLLGILNSGSRVSHRRERAAAHARKYDGRSSGVPV